MLSPKAPCPPLNDKFRRGSSPAPAKVQVQPSLQRDRPIATLRRCLNFGCSYELINQHQPHMDKFRLFLDTSRYHKRLFNSRSV